VVTDQRKPTDQRATERGGAGMKSAPKLVKKPVVSAHDAAPAPRAKKDSTKCVRDVRSVPPAAYRLASDGKKWRWMCEERRKLLMQMASYSNGDGTGIWPSVQRLADETGMSPRTAHRLLNDLKTLGFLEDGELHGCYKTRIRSINVGKVKAGVSFFDKKGEAPLPNSPAPLPNSPNTSAGMYLADNRPFLPSYQTENKTHLSSDEKLSDDARVFALLNKSKSESEPTPSERGDNSLRERTVVRKEDFVILREKLVELGVNRQGDWSEKRVSASIAKSFDLADGDVELVMEVYERVVVEMGKLYVGDFFPAVCSYLENYGGII
jgi:hypothetical protein